MPFDSQSRKRLMHLPNELILNIMTHMPDLETLCNFVKVSAEAADLYGATPKMILNCTRRQCYPLQMQKIIGTIISIRSHPRFATIDCIDEYLEAHFEDEKTPSILDDLSNPLQALFDIVVTIASSFRELGTCVDHPENPPSQTEVYRIDRGLWRL